MTQGDEHTNLALFMLSHIAAHGKLDFEDYRQAWDVAMADGVLDEKERRILHRLLELLPPKDIPADLQQQVAQLRAHYNI